VALVGINMCHVCCEDKCEITDKKNKKKQEITFGNPKTPHSGFFIEVM